MTAAPSAPEAKTAGRDARSPLVRLGDITRIRTGKLDANAQRPGGQFPFFTCGEEILQIDHFAFDTEAVLLAGNGNFNLKWYSGKFNAYQRTYVIEPNGVEGKWLFYAMQSALPTITGGNRGSTVRFIRIGDITECRLPLPPLPEQRRIVAEIEQQFTRLDAGVAALRRTQANLKRYRAAVLKAACEGRLVPTDLRQWRKLKVSEIGKAVTGNTPPTDNKSNLGSEVPFFKPTDLDAGYNVREARQYLSPKGAEYARVLPPGSILVTCIGATIGKTGFARVPCATNQQINALVVDSKIATPEWMFCALTSPVGQQQIKSNASATTLPILNKSKFEALNFPTPPLAEQTRIIAEVERRLSVVDELEVVVKANLQRSIRLRQSILKQFFTAQ